MSRSMIGRRWWTAAVLLGVGGGVAWRLVTHPALWSVTETGLSMTEDQSRHQFGAVVNFVLIGAIVAVLFGFALGVTRTDVGWRLVPSVAGMMGFASVFAWSVGRAFGPSDPSAARHKPLGTRVPDVLTVDSVAPFLAWAVFGVAGLLVGTWLRDRRPASDRR